MTTKDTRLVTVCAECLRASCWQAKFMCDKAQSADTLDLPVYELQRLNREHPSYWERGVVSIERQKDGDPMTPRMDREIILRATGHELNCIIARLKGWTEADGPAWLSRAWVPPQFEGARQYWRPLPKWSTDWGYAGPLLEEMADGGAWITFHGAEVSVGHAATLIEVMRGVERCEAIARAYCLWQQRELEVKP